MTERLTIALRHTCAISVEHKITVLPFGSIYKDVFIVASSPCKSSSSMLFTVSVRLRRPRLLTYKSTTVVALVETEFRHRFRKGSCDLDL